jgi:succinyl-CoA synthetase alpha subunit
VLIPAASTEFLHVPVAAPSGTDLTGAAVRIAVVAHRADPADDEWQEAAWVSGSARILVGPGSGTVLEPGDYRVWINIDPPGAESIVRKSGVLSVT